jgi:hypothetical protein
MYVHWKERPPEPWTTFGSPRAEVVEVLDARAEVPAVQALVAERAEVGALADLLAEVELRRRVAEVVEERVRAEARLAEAAEVDADVLEEVVLDLDEARLDVDHDPGRLAQVGQELLDLLVHLGDLVHDHLARGRDLQAVLRVLVPRARRDVVLDQLLERVGGDDVRLALDLLLFRELDAP